MGHSSPPGLARPHRSCVCTLTPPNLCALPFCLFLLSLLSAEPMSSRNPSQILSPVSLGLAPPPHAPWYTFLSSSVDVSVHASRPSHVRLFVTMDCSLPGSSVPGILQASTLELGRTQFNPWVGKILWRRKWQPTLVFLLGKCHGQRCLEGYSPWGHKEWDTTE